MNTKALLLELLLSGFFAIACFKARTGDIDKITFRPRDFLRLASRLERLSRSRWQWFAMVLVLVMVRLQSGLPLWAELTAASQLIVFLALPVAKAKKKACERKPLTQWSSTRADRGSIDAPSWDCRPPRMPAGSRIPSVERLPRGGPSGA